MLKIYLALVLCTSVLLTRPTAAEETFMFYEENFNGKPCNGGVVSTKDSSWDCVDGRRPSVDIFQSFQYYGDYPGVISAYAVQNNNNCGAFVSNGRRCASSGNVPLITAARLESYPCKTPWLCSAVKQRENKENPAPNALDNLQGWVDNASDMAWMLVPGSFDEEEYKKAKLSGYVEGFIKTNYTFYSPLSQLTNKEKWVYRDTKNKSS
ncbi:hypothetical protein BGW38_001777 [Lunasporangiospora selenospora]|uniref:Uncharacterized protein n=1 Tax=Lunasporangiospora selenospora TaxID=979761 RepID=A0A9P6FU51_9FUNG|nr:hypothetical protein BGW38_001777 [Lunasporangiospora selenospora]